MIPTHGQVPPQNYRKDIAEAQRSMALPYGPDKTWLSLSAATIGQMTTSASSNIGPMPFPAKYFDFHPRPRSQTVNGKAKSSSRSNRWAEFVQHTTIHGLRFIYANRASSCRKLLWILLVLASLGMLGYQIIDRVIHYSLFPITVNVDINFNKTLLFPAITICNQNTFRATKATELHRYRVLEAMYTSTSAFNTSMLSDYNISDVTLDDLFLSAAHSKHDFIVDCTWQKQSCGPDNFTQVLTDHGVCFTFTPSGPRPLYVTSAGSEYGLKLALNVEKYEYMPGPNDGAGVKVLLHDEKEFPKVAELGLAIPTGTHAIVSIEVALIQSLPPPRGSCQSRPSPYYRHYTRENCQLACLTEYMAKACGCRHHYMPHDHGYPPVCTMRQYYDCYRKQMARFRKEAMENCDCPIPCSFLIFDPFISFATTSDFATHRLLSMASWGDEFRSRYLTALETTQRMEENKFQATVGFAQMAETALQNMTTLLRQDIPNTLQKTEDVFRSVTEQLKTTWELKNHLYHWQKHNVQRNFMRVRDSMNERTFHPLTLGFQEFATLTELRIQLLLDTNVTSQDLRQATYLLLMMSLKAKIDLADRAFANYTELMSIYTEGTPLFSYTYLGEPLKDNDFIAPKPLLRHALQRNDFVRNSTNLFGEDIMRYKSALTKYVDVSMAAYYGNETVGVDDILQANIEFLSSGRLYNKMKNVFDIDSIDYPVQVIEKRIEAFRELWEEYDRVVQDRLSDIQNLKLSLDSLENSVLKFLISRMQMVQRYVMGDDVRMYDIAVEMTSESIHVCEADLKVFFESLRSRGRKLHDSWSRIAKIVTDIWQLVIDDEDMLEYYVYKNYTQLLRNMSEVAAEIEDEFEDYRLQSDVQELLGNADSKFLRSLAELIADMEQYLLKSAVGADVVKQNLVQLAVYHRQNYVEQITQQVAYDISALLCDIGGSMGLFVGASVLSVGELFDLCLHQSFYNLFRKRVN